MLKAGKYYVGDLCYVLGDKNGYDWMEVLESTNYLRSKDGMFSYRGVKFFSSSTMYGDGYYPDNEGRGYGVDAGLIGCFPIAALEDRDGIGDGHVVTFEKDFDCLICDESDGVIQIGRLAIQTGGYNE
jgi:hypothetical protein